MEVTESNREIEQSEHINVADKHHGTFQPDIFYMQCSKSTFLFIYMTDTDTDTEKESTVAKNGNGDNDHDDEEIGKSSIIIEDIHSGNNTKPLMYFEIYF